MPELPEVETTLQGIKSHVIHRSVSEVLIRNPCLRFPIPSNLPALLKGQVLSGLKRRGKYILFEFKKGTAILHLGMSGRLSVLKNPAAPQKHDHVDICFSNKICLRFTDPRRFGALLWTDKDPNLYPLLKHIGPEPLTNDFSGEYLYQKSRGRKVCVKSFLMNSAIVAGVGNIYATEALFLAGIRPQKMAGKINLAAYKKLAKAVKKILEKAIKKGGTTLKDFMKSDGSPGYFSIELKAYGRGGEPCLRCHTKLKSARLGQRSTVYCIKCQK